MTVLIMRQTAKNRWRIEFNDVVLVDDIILPNKFYAEEYVKAYVSTWAWEYRLESL